MSTSKEWRMMQKQESNEWSKQTNAAWCANADDDDRKECEFVGENTER